MEGIESPDIPALLCYGLVLLAGLIVARRNVAKSLEGLDGRWRFSSTWMLFAAYTLLPIFLFWLLSWTEVVHDTSVVAAVIVGLGYRQVATTGLAGITVKGQWKVWQPFEAWANGIATKIVEKHAVDRATAFRDLESEISGNTSSLGLLGELAEELAFEADALKSLRDDLARIAAELVAPVSQQPSAEGRPVHEGTTPAAPTDKTRSLNRLRARRLLREVRVRAEDFDRAMTDRGVVTEDQLDRAFGRTRSLAAVAGALALGAAIVAAMVLWAPWQKAALQVRYYTWRLGVEQATPADLDRTYAFFSRSLPEDAGDEALSRVVGRLRGRVASVTYADRAIPMLIEARARRPGLDSVLLPALIESLRAKNADVRVRVQNALNEIRELDYADRDLDDGTRNWSPTDRDRATAIEAHVRRWRAWWESPSPGAGQQQRVGLADAEAASERVDSTGV